MFETDGEADGRMLGPQPWLAPHGPQSEKDTGQDVRITGHQAVSSADGGITDQTLSSSCHGGHQTENPISPSNMCDMTLVVDKKQRAVLTASEKRVKTLKLCSSSHAPKPLWEN